MYLGLPSKIIVILRMCMSNEHCRAHEAWDLPEPPDFVTFAKKMQIGGFYSTAGTQPKEVGIVTVDAKL